MKKYIIAILVAVMSFSYPSYAKRNNNQTGVSSQYRQNDGSRRRKSTILKNSGEQKEARDLLVLYEVVNFKLEDERLAKEIDELDENPKFNKKMDSIMEKLSNEKRRDNKNKDVERILQDAGNKLYNLLAD